MSPEERRALSVRLAIDATLGTSGEAGRWWAVDRITGGLLVAAKQIDDFITGA